MDALVIGVSSYLGSHICLVLKKRGFYVRATYHKKTPLHQYYDELYQLDINNPSIINTYDFKGQYVFLLSALTGTYDSIINYKNYIEVNEIGLLHILSKIKEIPNKPTIIFPSSRLVYEGVSNKTLIENESKLALTVYAQTKIAGENYLKMFNSLYGIDYYIFRIGVPYGNNISSNYSYGTIGFMLSQIKEKKKIQLYGKGQQKRTFTHVEDIANQILDVITSANSENTAYNIAGETLSVLVIANMIAKYFNGKVQNIEWPEIPLKLESGDTIFDSSKIIKYIKRNNHSFESWIQELVK